MPIYEYECKDCGNIEEVLQQFSDKPLKKCPHCSGKLQKLISQSTFHLKGTGWYVTDYANKDKGASSTAEKPDKTDASSNEKKKTEKTSSDTKDS